MKINRNLMTLAMARSCVSLMELAQKAALPLSSVKNALYGRNIRPSTAGKIARALGVDVADLLETKEA